MKDVATPVVPEDVRSMIQTSLENAALVNYTQLSQKANIEGKYLKSMIPLSARKKLIPRLPSKKQVMNN